MEFPMHWLIVLAFLSLFVVIPWWLFYRLGKKMGDREGYIRGYKEGQQSVQK